MKIGYARVSTDEQNLDLQIDALEKAGCEKIYRDVGISGIQINRHGLDEAMASLQEGDTLIVWRLDRLGRSLHHLIETINYLKDRGIGFTSLNEAINTNTAGGELLFHVMGALAQFERRLISERSKAGMAAAKRRGKHVGRPLSLTTEQLNHAKEMVSKGLETVSGMAQLYGINRTTLHRALRRCEFAN